MAEPIRRFARVLFPGYTNRGRSLRRLAMKMGLGSNTSGLEAYDRYLVEIEPALFLPPVRVSRGSDSPLISVVIPFFNTPDKYLVPLLDSLSSQSFVDWEVVMADASTDATRARRIEELSSSDSRFVYHRLAGNKGIAANTNGALERARGRFIAFADHDDTLSPHALNEVAAAVASNPTVDILYSDEDALSEDGLTRKRPFFKPAWSPHLFLEMNYTNHLSVIRADLIREVGGLRPEMDGAQDYDLLLRLHSSAAARHVVHIPKILYHWREAEQSTARVTGNKQYAITAGERALTGYLNSLGIDHDGVDRPDRYPAWYRVHPRWRCRAEIIVRVSADDRVNRHFAHLLDQRTSGEWVTPVVTVLTPGADLRAHRTGRDEDVVVVVDEMFLPEKADWLDELAGVLALPRTLAVAPLLLRDTRTEICNAGYVEEEGVLQPLFAGSDSQADGVTGPVDLVRNVDGLSSAVVAFRSDDCAEVDLSAGVFDGRGRAGACVVWSHVRFAGVRVPDRSGYLNGNLRSAGPAVLLRTDTGKRR